MNKNKTNELVTAAIVAALYVVLTLVSKPLTIGFVEIRFSEVLTVLPYFMPSTVWGLFAGCLIANIFSGSIVDVVIGSLATLIGAYLTSKIKIKWLCPLPTVLSNTLLIPFVIMLPFPEPPPPERAFPPQALRVPACSVRRRQTDRKALKMPKDRRSISFASFSSFLATFADI